MLVIISAVLGIWGGKLAAVATGIVSASQFDQGLFQYLKPFQCIFCPGKSYTFAFIISSISSFFGYYVKGGALEIGRASTKSVVVSCIMILFADYVLSAFSYNETMIEVKNLKKGFGGKVVIEGV